MTFNNYCQDPYKTRVLEYSPDEINFKADWFSYKTL